jgi:hypothetical protein
MATKRSTSRLERYEHRYRELARQLAEIGYVASGSLAQRFTRCGRPTCACAGDPPKLHGPYWHMTGKVEGKTRRSAMSWSEVWCTGGRAVAVRAERR